MVLTESDEPPSGLWGKVDLDDLPGPNAADHKPELPLITRKPTLMGYVVPQLDGSAIEALDSEPPGAEQRKAGASGFSGTVKTEAERFGQLVDNLSDSQRNMPIHPGRTLIGGSFAGTPNKPPALAISKGTLLGVPAPILEPSFNASATQPIHGLKASRPTPETGTPQAGHLGRFKIVRKIGAGRAGAVFLAQREESPGNAQLLAVKVLREQVYQDQAAVKALFREARLAAMMDHRNVVRVIDIGYYKRQPYVVMEFVDGLSLAAILAHPVAVPLPVGMRCIIDALHGLDYAHKLTDPRGVKLGLVHCDVSPENILVGIDGTARVTDFGVARIREEDGEEFVFRGRATYSAPELLGGEQNVTPQSDVYSMGAVLFRLATGVAPFSGKTEEERTTNALTRVAARVRDLNPRLPEWLDQIVARALNRDPSRRFVSCAEMAMALEREAASDALLAEPAAVGEWVGKVRRSLSGEEAFAAQELAPLAADAARRSRPEGLASTQLNMPVPVTPPEASETAAQPEEESSTLQFRIGVGAALFLLLALVAAWALFSPESFQEFIHHEQEQPTTSRPHALDSLTLENKSGTVGAVNPALVRPETPGVVASQRASLEAPAVPGAGKLSATEPSPRAAGDDTPNVGGAAETKVVVRPVVAVVPRAPSPPRGVSVLKSATPAQVIRIEPPSPPTAIVAPQQAPAPIPPPPAAAAPPSSPYGARE